MIEIHNLSGGYRDKDILNGISFAIKKDETTAIIGPNGSGKTTLLRALCRILPRINGTILFNGTDIRKFSARQRARRIALVSQHTETSNRITVEDFVLLGRYPYRNRLQIRETRRDRDRAREAMDLTETFRFRNRFFQDLSAGERQMVCIAKALAQEPELLLLDEPTNYLDIAHQMMVMDLISELLKKSAITVVMVMHDLNLAGRYGERIILLNRGTIEKTGRPGEVIQKETIEKVYGITVRIREDELFRRPYIIPVSGKQKDQQ